jgi:hypothetical protein
MERNVTAGHGPLRRETPAVVAAVLALSTLAGCGSSGSVGARAAASIAAPCTQVASVLSDGPDPGADPVGDAQAQVLQLCRLGISEQPLHRAIDALASAYQNFSQTDGSAGAKAGVSRAVHEVSALCPGATE